MRVQTCRPGDEMVVGGVRLVVLSVHRGKVRLGVEGAGGILEAGRAEDASRVVRVQTPDRRRITHDG